jgi:hypothetical protein
MWNIEINGFLMEVKRITTTFFRRDDGLTDDEIKERIQTMGRKIEMAKKKAAAKKAPGEKKKVDRDKLKSLLEKGGMTAQELKKELGGVAPLALKNAVLRVMTEEKKFYEVPGLFGKAPGNIKFTAFGIRIPKERLGTQFKKGDEFSFMVEENRIVLSKVQGAE